VTALHDGEIGRKIETASTSLVHGKKRGLYVIDASNA